MTEGSRSVAGIRVRRAHDDELERTVRLRWLWAVEVGEPSAVDEARFVAEAAAWARAHAATHLPHVAVTTTDEIVGMAWLALTPRVATTKSTDRWSGDLQSCYVVPDERGRGVAAALVRAVMQTAAERGVEHVTVHATADNAVRVYASSGFATSGRLLIAKPAR